MKLRSKGRRAKGVEAPIFSPQEESLVDKALYASLQTNKKRRLDFSSPERGESSCSKSSSDISPDSAGKVDLRKLPYAARKTASIIAAGTSGALISDTSFENDENPGPSQNKNHDKFLSTEKFLTFMAFRGTPYLPESLSYIEDIPWERLTPDKKPANQKNKKIIAPFRDRGRISAQKSLAKAKKSLLLTTKCSSCKNVKNKKKIVPKKQSVQKKHPKASMSKILVDAFSGVVLDRFNGSFDEFFSKIDFCDESILVELVSQPKVPNLVRLPFRKRIQEIHLLCENEKIVAVRRCIFDHIGQMLKNTPPKIILYPKGVKNCIETKVDLAVLYLIVRSLRENSADSNRKDDDEFWRLVAKNVGVENLLLDPSSFNKLKNIYDQYIKFFENMSLEIDFMVEYYLGLIQRNEIALIDDEWVVDSPYDVASSTLAKLLTEISSDVCASGRIVSLETAEDYFWHVVDAGHPMLVTAQGTAVELFRPTENGADVDDSQWFLFDLPRSKGCCLSSIANKEKSLFGPFLSMESCLTYQPWLCTNWGMQTVSFLFSCEKPKMWYVTKPNDFWQVHRILTESRLAGHPTITVEKMKSLGIEIHRLIQHRGELIIFPSFTFRSSICSDFTISETVNVATKSWFDRINSIQNSPQFVGDGSFGEDIIMTWPSPDFHVYVNFDQNF